MLRHRVLQNYVQQYGSGIWYMVYGTLGPQPMRACSVFCVRLQETFDATAAFTTRVRAHRLRQDLPPRPGICFPIAAHSSMSGLCAGTSRFRISSSSAVHDLRPLGGGGRSPLPCIRDTDVMQQSSNATL